MPSANARVWCLFFGLAALVAVIFAAPLYSQDYVVGERDVLRVTVYDHPDLTTVGRVSGEGTFFFPFLGDVKVKGLTIPQIAVKISSQLADGYIVNPQVSVFIEEYRSRKVLLIGEVTRPGPYELTGPTTLLELLSRAGLLSGNAGDEAIIKRKLSEGEQTVKIDLGRLIEKGDTTVDLVLQDGDTIYIPKAGVFYVHGEVKNPNVYKYKEGLTVIKAITMAGGFTDIASPKRIRIKRKENGKEVTLEKVGFDELVKADDVIVVPESLF
jgi:polysaccharide export outer membrane protein